MKTKILLLIIFLSFLKGESQTIDPYLISFTGNSITNGSYTLDYASGELVIETLSGLTNYCTQGLLQPNYNLPNGIESVEKVDVNVYPNPTSDFILIKASTSEKLKIVVYNVIGGVIGEYKSNSISLVDYPKGVFYIKIYNSKNHLIKTQSIIKI